MFTKRIFNQCMQSKEAPRENRATWEALAAIENNLADVRAALKILAQHPDEGIRVVVAQEFNCPIESLQLLAKDPSKEVRRQVALNPSSSFSVLNVLVKDHDADVSMAAKRNRQWLLRLGYSPWTHSYPNIRPADNPFASGTASDGELEKTHLNTVQFKKQNPQFFQV